MKVKILMQFFVMSISLCNLTNIVKKKNNGLKLIKQKHQKER